MTPFINQCSNGATIYEEHIHSVARICLEVNVSLQFKQMGIEYNHSHMEYALRGKRGTNDRNTNIMICWHNSGFRKSNASFACKCITKRQLNTDA